MKRALPSPAEALRILGERRTRPLRMAPPPAGRGLSRALKPLEERFAQGPQALHLRWPDIVGERLAKVSEPVRLVKSRSGPSTLEVRVAGPVAALVIHQSEEILARANLLLGSKAAAGRLKIVQGPVRAIADRATPGRPAARPPLDAAVEAELAASLEGADDRLKAALTRLGREVLRRG